MLSSARFGSPPRSRDNPPPPAHSYTSSSDESYGRINSLSRSESGTSRTHYEDIIANPSPKALMNQYQTRGSLDWSDNGPAHSPTRNPTRATAGVLQDPMAMHLLLETAVGDSAGFDVMSFEELDDLKKEEAAILRRIPTLRRDLQLETKLRDTASSFSQISDPNNPNPAPGAMSADEHTASVKKCEDLSTELYNLERRSTSLAERRLKHTAAILQIDYEQRSGQSEFQKINADEDDWASGFNLRAIAPGGLADTFDGIMDIPGGGDPHTDATLNDLWHVLSSHDAERGMGHDESFSLEKFSVKVQGLCDRASSLETQIQQDQARGASSEALQEVHDQHLAAEKKLQDSQAELTQARASLDQVKQELNFVKQQHEYTLNDELGAEREAHDATKQAHEAMKQQHDGVLERHQTFLREHEAVRQQLETAKATHEEEHGNLAAELARLQTEVTIAKAELDGAYGSRAERAADITENPIFKAKMETLETRNSDLERELRELVSEHENITRQGVDAERDRESLESTIDQLREKVETLEIRISEDKLRHMGRDGDTASTPGSAGADSRSLSVMRSEFKKMMRESRAEQLKVLRMEQEERRKLEAALRQLRKETIPGSPGLSPATLSPPPLPRSGLRQNMTAS